VFTIALGGDATGRVLRVLAGNLTAAIEVISRLQYRVRRVHHRHVERAAGGDVLG